MELTNIKDLFREKEKYADSHDSKLPVIGLKDSDFVFEQYKSAIIDKDAKKAAKKAETKYIGSL